MCRPYRAKTKGKVERFNGYLRRSFYVPLSSRLKQAALKLGVDTANIEVACWLEKIANERVHGTTGVQPCARLGQERPSLQGLPGPWRAAHCRSLSAGASQGSRYASRTCAPSCCCTAHGSSCPDAASTGCV